ncbi:sporulation integral membrane protein YtvI [Leptotrichia sp. oral taxon 218]|uniref:sporulation integral membrane protein YtvI n=1 Tax=Leptotrichia sp. oral taxon 218 TaxID=712361 RepID=UPI001B8D2B15|nr:sporulation integral membrane protein YtvI [Leptotrichia sp. oral taxon 218]QUB95974.1 sporulation integral membrane protein YtvI [Leptotrichia sp. oral taxon 218]
MASYKDFDFKKLYFIVYIALILLVVFLAFKLGVFLFPFTLALFISIIIRPLVRFLMNKLKFSKKTASIISIVTFLIVFFGLIGILSLKFFGEIYKLSQNLNNYSSDIQNLWTENVKKVYTYLGNFPAGFNDQLNNTINSFVSKGSVKLGSFINGVISFVTSIPTLILYIVITILSTFFMILDRDEILSYLEHQLPKSWLDKVFNIKTEMFTVLVSYLKAQAILGSICLIESLILLNLLAFLKFDVPYPLLMSIIICIADILPILGAGTILIPWSVLSFATGNIKLGIGLLISYLIIMSVRQMLEPKLISQNLGVHPLITLISMYSGFKVFGVSGFLIGPVVMIILKNVFSKELEVGFFRDIFGNGDDKNKTKKRQKKDK